MKHKVYFFSFFLLTFFEVHDWFFNLFQHLMQYPYNLFHKTNLYIPEQQNHYEPWICDTILPLIPAMPYPMYCKSKHVYITFNLDKSLYHTLPQYLQRLTWIVSVNFLHIAPPMQLWKVKVLCGKIMVHNFFDIVSIHLSLKNSAISFMAFFPLRCLSSRISNPLCSPLSAWVGCKKPTLDTVYNYLVRNSSVMLDGQCDGPCN